MTEATSGLHLWLVLMKAHRSMGRHASRSTGELGLSDFAILELLLHKGPQKVNDIGRIVALTSGSITSAVDRLEGAQLVLRSFHPTDRRSRMVALTPAGTRTITALFATHAEAMNDVASVLTEPERATLIGLLKKLGRGADARF